MYGKIDTKQLAQSGNLEFAAKQVVEGFITGMHRSPFHGFSVEFAEHRPYNSGESTKHIDWKLYAKTDKLFVKQYEEETNLRCRMLLDISSSMYFPKIGKTEPLNKLGFSIYAMAALTALFNRQRDGVGITVFEDVIKMDTAIKTSPSHLRRLYYELERLMVSQRERLNRTTSLAPVLHNVAETDHRRSLILIFSDFFSRDSLEDLTNAFLHLKHHQHEVILFYVFDQLYETSFDFPNKPTAFIDLESGEKINVHPLSAKAAFQKEATDFTAALKMKCSQFKIDFVEVDIRKSISAVLDQYLIKRQKIL